MTVHIDKLLAALDDESYRTRCDALRDCCPCRTGNLRDFEVWRAVFDKALRGNLRERDRAAHAIGTLTEKAVENPAWRGVLRNFKTELDTLRRDRRAARLLLGQMKKHGHAHRGAAAQGYRRRRKVLDLATRTNSRPGSTGGCSSRTRTASRGTLRACNGWRAGWRTAWGLNRKDARARPN